MNSRGLRDRCLLVQLRSKSRLDRLRQAIEGTHRWNAGTVARRLDHRVLNDRVRFSDEPKRAPLRIAAKLVIVTQLELERIAARSIRMAAVLDLRAKRANEGETIDELRDAMPE